MPENQRHRIWHGTCLVRCRPSDVWRGDVMKTILSRTVAAAALALGLGSVGALAAPITTPGLVLTGANGNVYSNFTCNVTFAGGIASPTTCGGAAIDVSTNPI